MGASKCTGGECASEQVVTNPRTRQPINLVITGFMGTGKTVVGREVARRLGWEFVDMDELIEKRLGMSIPEIFARYGEGFFRERERELCGELATKKGLVIATGGGALIPEENRRIMGANGLLICLTCEVDELLRRLRKVKDRPLLEVRDRRKRIEDLLAKRREAYSRIPYRIDTTGLTVEEVAERVIELLRGAMSTKRIPVRTPTGNYEVHLGRGLLSQVGRLAYERGLRGKAALVTNPTVGCLYASTVAASLQRAGFDPLLIEIPDGEAFKTLDTVRLLYEHFVEGGLERTSPIFALGGGVVGDTAGFAAATYMRGTPFVQLPTTLLAMVDASIGGKVGVDYKGKNLIGTFHQPALVVTDTDVLTTLPQEEFRCGLAEIIKAGVIGSPALFEHLERKGVEPLEWVIAEAIRVKAAIVEKDPYESGLRAVLNLGHTFGHALEALSDYRMRHGEAVSVGMVAAAKVAIALGLCGEEVEVRLISLLRRFGLPTRYQGYKPVQLWEAMAVDKKKRGGRLRFVLPQAIGKVVITEEVPREVVLKVLREMERSAEGS